ncbi:biotin-dependent carboxyltransferase [Thalassomonas sp. M1454]|nr:biotin-dependent carboxyltransferase [Thalassomonas sp. M1454]
MVVEKPGMLSLIQDLGRYGQHNIGLTTGGPLDPHAFKMANKLLQNNLNDSAIELTVGGLELTSQVNTTICVTGAVIDFTVNGEKMPQWQCIAIKQGDLISFGFATSGLRVYIAVKGGFNIEPTFGSTSTVTREGIGGINGTKIEQGQLLSCTPQKQIPHFKASQIPSYDSVVKLRVILGYQQDAFSQVQKHQFFSSEYTVSESFDRMGYRLEGPVIKPNVDGILSEGICLGAIQVPANGQPIVLMNDRQTIGGYPKIGSVFSLDLAKLAQCGQGAKILFEQITIEDAHNLLHLEQANIELNAIEPIEKLLS